MTVENADSTITTDSNTAAATMTPHPDSPGLRSHLSSPYPPRAAATTAAPQIPHRQFPASSMMTSTEGRPPEPPNALNLPHPVSISTICLSGTLVEKIHAISEAGFNNVEIYENDLVNFWGQLGEIRNLCYDLGLVIGSMRTDEGLEGTAEPLNGAEEGVAKAWRLQGR